MKRLLGSLMLGVLAAAALVCTTGGSPVSASSGRSGQVHIVKDCSAFNYMAGGTCKIVSSNLAEIPAGSLIHYTQAFGILNPAWIDSNVSSTQATATKRSGAAPWIFRSPRPASARSRTGPGTSPGSRLV